MGFPDGFARANPIDILMPDTLQNNSIPGHDIRQG